MHKYYQLVTRLQNANKLNPMRHTAYIQELEFISGFILHIKPKNHLDYAQDWMD